MTLQVAVLALISFSLAGPQDPTPPSPQPPIEQPPSERPPVEQAPAATPSTPAVAVELVRGVLPADASAEAKELFAKLVAATHVDPNAPSPSGFDLTFQGEAHPTPRQSNDFPKTRYRFDPRGWVRLTILASGRERMSGPQGMFVVDGKEVVKLSGREHDEDRRQVREELSIAKNFLALSDPKNLRVAKLEKLASAPSVLPSNLAAGAAKLEWLALESPDFRLFQSVTAAADANWRVELGLDPTTHLPKLGSVTELGNAAASGAGAGPGAKSMVAESAMLVEFRRYQALDGLQIPAELETYGLDAAAVPWKYSRWSSLKLGLCEGGTLRPKFSETDFSPPSK
ncbi:MAG: hypothetical protein IT453_08500 [Planctomycetes bacterium]|nr:hypothetical protein [Planctomycetota bacterium]